jgi:hypothetical protein
MLKLAEPEVATLLPDFFIKEKGRLKLNSSIYLTSALSCKVTLHGVKVVQVPHVGFSFIIGSLKF